MSNSSSLSVRKPSAGGVFPDIRRMSKPHLSRLILVGTGLIIAVVLLIWLLLFLGRDPVRFDGFWVSPTEMGGPWLAHQAADVTRGRRAPQGEGPADRAGCVRPLVAGTPRQVRQPAGRALRLRGRRLRQEWGLPPASANRVRSRPRRPRRPGTRSSRWRSSSRSAANSPSKPKLILWDAGQIGSDRNLGVYANGFIHELKKALEKTPNKLAILCSCAPGQTSWASEFDGRSVFGYYVEMGLSGKAVGFDGRSNGLTVEALSRYVRSQVAAWAKTNRQAEQTPELIGDLSMNFALPRASRAKSRPSAAPPAGEVAESEDEKRILARLEQAWTRLDELRKRKPYRAAPLRWQRLRETLLHAERLFRGGDFREAENVLGGLPGLEGDPSARPPMDVSLAMIENGLAEQPDEARRTAMRTASDQIDEAVTLLVSEVDPSRGRGRRQGRGGTAQGRPGAQEGGGGSGRARGCRPEGRPARTRPGEEEGRTRGLLACRCGPSTRDAGETPRSRN